MLVETTWRAHITGET